MSLHITKKESVITLIALLIRICPQYRCGFTFLSLPLPATLLPLILADRILLNLL